MKAIVVVDRNWAIGKDGGLLAHLPGDLKYFKEKTLGGVVIMGRNTLESLPGKKPLPGRKTIVLSTDETLAEELTEGAVVVHSQRDLFEELEDCGETGNVFVSGGQQVYEQLLPHCDEVYVTKIDELFEGADKYFPNLDLDDDWMRTWESESVVENGIRYRFNVYRKSIYKEKK